MSQSKPLAGEPEPQTAATPPRSWWQRVRGPLWRHGVAILLLGALWLATFWVFSRDCELPLGWHPDEAGKVRQVMSDGTERNFNHPLLMLEATSHWVKYFAIPETPASVAAAGRQVSAAFGASTVTFFAAAGYLACGLPGLILAGLAAGLCAPLMTASHYMKEDAGLATGVAATVFASRWVWNTRRWWSRPLPWLALGAACALAASGKYVGAVAVVVPVLCVLFAPAWRWWSLLPRLLLVLVGLLAVWATINQLALNPEGVNLQKAYQSLRSPDGAREEWLRYIFHPGFLNGFEREKEHSITEHRGLTAAQPNVFAVRTAYEECGWHIIILAGLLPVLMVLTWRRGWGWESILILFTLAFAALLSYSVILFARYALPLVLMLHFFAALAAARLVCLLHGRRRLQGVLLVVLANVFLMLQMPRWMAYAMQFGDDSRDQVKAWLADNLPSGALVYADDYAGLEQYGRTLGPLRQQRSDLRLATNFTASGFGTLEDLAARHAYVVICSTQYDRYLEPINRPAQGEENDFERAKRFYQALLKDYKPVWKKVERYPQRAFTSPDIYVYELPAAR